MIHPRTQISGALAVLIESSALFWGAQDALDLEKPRGQLGCRMIHEYVFSFCSTSIIGFISKSSAILLELLVQSSSQPNQRKSDTQNPHGGSLQVIHGVITSGNGLIKCVNGHSWGEITKLYKWSYGPLPSVPPTFATLRVPEIGQIITKS